MTAKLTGFDQATREITLTCDAMPQAVIGDIWIAHAEKDRCVWSEDWEGNYSTGCDRETCGMEDGLSMASHGIAFCCYCGKLIESKPYVEKEEA